MYQCFIIWFFSSLYPWTFAAILDLYIFLYIYIYYKYIFIYIYKCIFLQSQRLLESACIFFISNFLTSHFFLTFQIRLIKALTLGSLGPPQQRH